MSLEQLESQLSRAVASEDYTTAALLRDKLSDWRGDAELGVQQANARFYSAFARGSSEEMARAWGTGDHVRCLHPGAACILGRADVLASWDMVFRSGAKLQIRCEDVAIYARDGLALLTCIEVVDTPSAKGRLACTNIFEMQKGDWRLIHHHAHSLS